jgi:archaellum component FlaF (FlaF/FlaG flagellin family)
MLYSSSTIKRIIMLTSIVVLICILIVQIINYQVRYTEQRNQQIENTIETINEEEVPAASMYQEVD